MYSAPGLPALPDWLMLQVPVEFHLKNCGCLLHSIPIQRPDNEVPDNENAAFRIDQEESRIRWKKNIIGNMIFSSPIRITKRYVVSALEIAFSFLFSSFQSVYPLDSGRDS